MFHYMGICTYTLARPTSGNMTWFEVQIRNEHRRGATRVSWVKHVIISVYDKVFRLDQGAQVFVRRIMITIVVVKTLDVKLHNLMILL